MATIKDVARISGYSVCTVSKALSGKGYIRDSTKEKILHVVKEVGYRPNQLAVSLKTGHSKTLALIVPDVMNAYFPRLEKYVDRYAGQYGYMVILCNTNNSLEREKQYIQNLIKWHVDGVIITPCSPEHSHFRQLKEEGIAYVYLNRHIEGDLGHCIELDNRRGGYECTDYLVRQGFTRISGIFQSFGNSSHEERFEGMKKALADAGLSCDQNICLFGVDDFDKASVMIHGLLEREDRPEAIFASNDMLALSVYQAADECGLKIPDDLSVVGYDNSWMSDKIVPKLTSYYSPARESAESAIRFLVKEIAKEQPEKPDILEGRLIEKESVRLKQTSEKGA